MAQAPVRRAPRAPKQAQTQFAAIVETDRSSDNECGVYDGRSWPGQRGGGMGGWLGIYEKLPTDDVLLNRLVMDATDNSIREMNQLLEAEFLASKLETCLF